MSLSSIKAFADTATNGMFSSEAQREKAIQDIIYGRNQDTSIIQNYRELLRIAYEGLRSEIGSALNHVDLFRRYVIRSIWYDRKRLANLIKANPSNQEEALTSDLALYLFDNGLSTLYRVKRGIHEYDLIGGYSDHQVFVEVKVYRNNQSRQMIINGIAQLHSYLSSLEAETEITEDVYYIIYRLGGPLYDLPWRISTNRYTFNLMIVDLGESQQSGRRQPKPIVIKQEEFLQEIFSSS